MESMVQTQQQPARPPAAAPASAAAINTYRREHFGNLPPVRVIHKLLEIAIQACKKEDKTLATKALTELTLALNFDYKEIALGFFRLYDYCKQRVHKGQFADALVILEDLRATWAQAFHLKEAA